MNQEALSLAHSKALAAAGRLRLPFRSKTWKGQSGEFQGGGVGSSMDFQDHRTYVPGDDPRHINWQAYARTGTYTMKLYREEVRPVVDIALDVSSSMFFDEAKATRVAELFYFCVESSYRSGAATHIHLVQGDVTRAIPVEAVRHHGWFDEITRFPQGDPAVAPNLSHLVFQQNAIRVLISDLLFDLDPDPLLHLMGARQGFPIILCPHLSSEGEPDWMGNYEFIDVERKTRHQHRVEPSVLKRFKASYIRHFSLWKQSAQRHQALFARVAAEADLQSSLSHEAVPVGALEIAH
ncbi:MAG: DUF58 domain-containing protein [Verrucomicrobiales bacterium]